MSAADDFIIPVEENDPSLLLSDSQRSSEVEEASDPLMLNIMNTESMTRESVVQDAPAETYGIVDNGDWDSDSSSDEDDVDEAWARIERGEEDTSFQTGTEALVERVKERDTDAILQLCREGDPAGVQLLEEWLDSDNSLRQQLFMLCASSLDEETGQTPLHLAVSTQSVDWLLFIISLIASGTKSNPSKLEEELSYADNFGNTPLHYACLTGNIELIGSLLEARASATAVNRAGKTILHCAAESGMKDAVEIIIDSKMVSLQTARTLMEQADVEGLYPLHIAAATSSRDTLEAMLVFLKEIFNDDSFEVQHFLNKVAVDLSKRTVLHMSAFQCDIASTLLLIDAGADVHQVDGEKRSVVHWAVTGKTHDNVDARICRYLEALQEEDASVLQKDNRNRSALHYAAYYQHVGACQLLTANGLSVMESDRQGWNALHYAAATGPGALESLLNVAERVSVVQTKSKRSMNPLHVAAKYGQEEALEILLDYVSPEEQKFLCAADANKRTLLFYCCLNDLHDGYNTLFQCRGNVGANKSDKRKMTIFHAAAQSPSAVDVFSLAKSTMEEEEFDSLVRAKDANGCTIAHHAAATGGIEVLRWIASSSRFDGLLASKCHKGNPPAFLAANRGQLPALQFLLQDVPGLIEDSNLSADEVLHLRNKSGHSILHAAVATAEPMSQRIVEYVLTIADDVGVTDDLLHSRDNDGLTPLLTAAEHGGAVAVDILERAGGDLSTVDKKGFGVLHYAALNGHERLVDYLISLDQTDPDITLDFERRSKEGLTPLHLAAYGGSLGSCNSLLSRSSMDALDNAGNNMLHYAAASDAVRVVAMLCTRDPSLAHAKNLQARTPMDTAAFFNSVETVRTLGRVGGEDLINAADADGRTPLMAAAASGFHEALFVLREMGADPNWRDQRGRTALHWAAAKGSEQTIEALSEAVSDPALADSNGMTPLHLAAYHNNSAAIDILAEELSEEYTNAVDHRGRTALHIAAAVGNDDAVDVLIRLAGIEIALADKKGRTAEEIAAARGFEDISDALAEERKDLEQGSEDEDYLDGEVADFDSDEEDELEYAAETSERLDSDSLETPEQGEAEVAVLVDKIDSIAESAGEEPAESHALEVSLEAEEAEDAPSAAAAAPEEVQSSSEGLPSTNEQVEGVADVLEKNLKESASAEASANVKQSRQAEDADCSMDIDEDWDNVGDLEDTSGQSEAVPISANGELAERPITGETEASPHSKVRSIGSLSLKGNAEEESFGEDLDWGEEPTKDEVCAEDGALLSLPEAFDEGDFDSAFEEDASITSPSAQSPSGALLSLPVGFDVEEDFDSAFDEVDEDAEASTSTIETAVVAQQEGKKAAFNRSAEEEEEPSDFGDDDFSWADDEGEITLPTTSATSPPALALSVTKTGAGRGTITFLQPGTTTTGGRKAESSPVPRMDSDVAAAFAKQALRQLHHKKDIAKQRRPTAVDDGFGDGFDEEDLEAAFADAPEEETPLSVPQKLPAFSSGQTSAWQASLSSAAASVSHTRRSSISLDLPPIDATFSVSSTEDTTLVRFFRQEKARLLQQVAECQDLLEEVQQYNEAKLRYKRRLSGMASMLPSSPFLRVLLLLLFLWLFLFFISRLPIINLEPVAYPS